MGVFELSDNHLRYVSEIETNIKTKVSHNKRTAEALAHTFGIDNKNLVKELTELAIVRIARSIAHDQHLTDRQKYDQITDLYHSQVNLSQRTSASILLQQYSTPAPISFLAGMYVRKTNSVISGLSIKQLSEPEIIKILRDHADEFRSLRLTQNNFFLEFGHDGMVKTPIGTVVIDMDQFLKMKDKHRERYFGLIRPTLTDPLFVVWDGRAEIFIKSFYERSSNRLYFVSIVRQKAGEISVVSNYTQRESQVVKKIREGNITYQSGRASTALDGANPPSPDHVTLWVSIPYRHKDKNLSGMDDVKYFEPSAGNGLLTIALPYESTYVNELDEIRLANLHTQPYAYHGRQDATIPFPDFYKAFDGIITNPPFGTLQDDIIYDGFPIRTLDHLMALRALDCMKDTGRAAIIIGGHTTWDDKGRIQAGKNRIFFNYLYSHYHVEDVILIDGHKLYSRQGTSFDVRLILVNGRKSPPEGFAPLKSAEFETVIYSFDELWGRVGVSSSKVEGMTLKEKLKNKALSL